MMNNLPVTIVGNLTADPELRFTPSGAGVANFTVAHTPRSFDRQANQWKDGESTFLRCSVWRDQAENVCESLHRGDRVIVVGSLTSRSYETSSGEKRTVIECTVDAIGPSLERASAEVKKVASRSKQPDAGWGGEQAKQGTVHTPPSGGWGQQPAAGWGEPPF